jgi:hypothetical protein
MRALSFAISALLALVVVGDASAQRSPGNAAAPGAVVGAAKQIQTGKASMPGDENLSCEQIGAEMERMFSGTGDMQSMLSSAKRADTEVKKSQAELAKRQATEAPELMAASMAETKAAVGMSMAPMTAIGQVSAARDALAAKKRMEELNQQQARKAVEGGRAGRSATESYQQSAANLVTNNTDQMTRMRVLSELSEKKGCPPPPGMPEGGFEGDTYDEEMADQVEDAAAQGQAPPGFGDMAKGVMGMFKKK